MESNLDVKSQKILCLLIALIVVAYGQPVQHFSTLLGS
jgi:hypothetical protein